MKSYLRLLGGLTVAGASPSPYAGQEMREIKALSGSSKMSDLLAGRGMGLAKIARYEQLRGYAIAPAHDQHDGSHHHAD